MVSVERPAFGKGPLNTACSTPWQSNVAMETHPFIDDVPIDPIGTSIWSGFSWIFQLLGWIRGAVDSGRLFQDPSRPPSELLEPRSISLDLAEVGCAADA